MTARGQHNVSFLSWIFAGFVYAGLIFFGWKFYDTYQKNKSQYDLSKENNFTGFDWIKWVDTRFGVKAEYIHPVQKNRIKITGGKIEEDDILKGIDYKTIYDSETGRKIVRSIPPGQMVVYQIQRERPDEFSPNVPIPIFIENGWYPNFSFPLSPYLWHIFVWLLVIGSFVTFVFLLIIYPVIRVNPRENAFIFFTLALVFIWFLIQLVRHLGLILEFSYSTVKYEKQLLYFLIAVWMFVGWLAVFSRSTGLRSRLLSLPFLAVGIFYLYFVRQILYREKQFASNEEIITDFIHIYFLLSLLYVFGMNLLEKWNAPRFSVRTVGFLFCLFLFISLGYYAVEQKFLFDWWDVNYARFCVQLMVFSPVLLLSNRLLRFGKVGFVLTNSIIYLIGILSALLAYIVIHQFFGSGLQPSRYQGVIEVAVLILAFLVARQIYIKNEPWVRKRIMSAQQKRNEQMNEFIMKISRYSDSRRLIEDIRVRLADYLGVEEAGFWTDTTSSGTLAEYHRSYQDFSVKELQDIYSLLHREEIFWERSKVLSDFRFDSIEEDKILRNDLGLIFYVIVPDSGKGLMLVRRKVQGVFNFYEIEVIQRVIAQLQLTLEVLNLLEKEKILIQKNAEANLIALRSQINPHFLFNTLNTISSLINGKPKLAERAVEKLAFIFRYTLKYSNENFVPLENEMSLVQNYLDIEKIRFGEQLNVKIQSEDSCLKKEIPAFSLQTIVENCIKHGISKLVDETGEVDIKVQRENSHIICTVKDNGPGIDLARVWKGTGLNNVASRLKRLYNREDLLKFENKNNRSVVTLIIPDNENAQ